MPQTIAHWESVDKPPKMKDGQTRIPVIIHTDEGVRGGWYERRQVFLPETPPVKRWALMPAPPNDRKEDAQAVLDHLNKIAGRRFASTKYIEQRMKKGATKDELILVLDYLNNWWEPKIRKKYMDTITPFRANLWEGRLDKAREWKIDPVEQEKKSERERLREMMRAQRTGNR